MNKQGKLRIALFRSAEETYLQDWINEWLEKNHVEIKHITHLKKGLVDSIMIWYDEKIK